jgi:hypothetical protein
MSTPTRNRQYTRYRQRAAVRRRRITLLLVLALSLCIVGAALAYPQLQGGDATVAATPANDAQPATPAATPEGDAGEGGGGGGGGAEAAAGNDDGESDQAAAAGASTEEDGLPVVTEKWPDWKPTPQAQAAIDEALANGRPPQFLLSSFDGAADIEMYSSWLRLAEQLGARFTFFVSGIYLLLPQNATAYQPPHKPAGFSNLGGYAELAGSGSAVENLYDNFKAFDVARMMGNEIGTHYVSHICDESNTWTTEDWVSEQSQWERLMLEPTEVNGLKRPITTILTKEDFHGGRSPCLMGDKPALYAAMKQLGYQYDASQEGILGQWPTKQQGLWNFPLPSIPRVGSKYATLAMDYNFYFNHGKTDDPAKLKTLENWTYRSYMGALNGLYTSNRAPLSIGSHFATWNSGVYNRALDRTLRKACTKPEVACVTYITLARWLDQQTPAQLAKWNAGDFPPAS